MRYGILSDIHGNLEALDAALAALGAAGVSSYVCLGDIVGYGADPNPCCERIRALGGLCIRGNHDVAAIGGFDLEWFNDHARAAAEWTARELSLENRAFLAGLPETQVGGGFQIAHGSLADPVEEYITDVQGARKCLELQSEPLCLVGHTHVPVAFRRRRGSLFCGALALRSSTQLWLDPDCDYVVNCGSVGQPRDGEPAAACGVYDSEAAMITLLRAAYQVEVTQSKIVEAGLPSVLAARLASGW